MKPTLVFLTVLVLLGVTRPACAQSFQASPATTDEVTGYVLGGERASSFLQEQREDRNQGQSAYEAADAAAFDAVIPQSASKYFKGSGEGGILMVGNLYTTPQSGIVVLLDETAHRVFEVKWKGQSGTISVPEIF